MSDDAALLGLEDHAWAGGPVRPDVLAALRAVLDADNPPREVPVDVRDAVPALVALVPEALARHRRLGVPDDAARDTLRDVGRKVRAYGATTDVGWLVGLLRADVVALGRLQFERVAAPDGRGVHIPEQGPLDPDGVDAALASARELLGPDPLTCTSWLLDPALPAGLPASSNIVRFAARFAVPDDGAAARGLGEPVGPDAGPTHGDHAVAKFVFRRPLAEVLDPAAVVPRTRLEHLVVQQLRAGHHWSEPRGVLRQQQRPST